MNRGYIKLWRKIADNQSWSRGATMRGLMLTLLCKANWKPSFFAGISIKEGQIAISAQNLATELNIHRTTLLRLLSILENEGFINRKNMNNQFTLISIINWSSYQCEIGKAEQPRLQPANNLCDTSKEDKKDKKSILDITPQIKLAQAFQEAVKERHQNLAPKITQTLITKGAQELEKATRLDGFLLDETQAALFWALDDDFWGQNIKSLTTIRKTMRNGTTKIQSILTDYHKRGVQSTPQWIKHIKGELL